ncbi:Epimerase domain-containing protein [Psidium guajava]|nr:Epimerase domain-containing protein [Psidium guajava]
MWVDVESSLVGRDEITRVVKGQMEGEEGKGIQRRMKGLKDATAKVLGEDGSSTRSLSKLALKWEAKLWELGFEFLFASSVPLLVGPLNVHVEYYLCTAAIFLAYACAQQSLFQSEINSTYSSVEY